MHRRILPVRLLAPFFDIALLHLAVHSSRHDKLTEPLPAGVPWAGIDGFL